MTRHRIVPLLPILLLLLAVAKNVVNYQVTDYARWVFWDWGLRVAVIVACIQVLRLSPEIRRHAGWRLGPLAPMLTAFLFFGLLVVLSHSFTRNVLMPILPGTMRMPVPDNPALLLLDIYLGLALVALSEELAFRGVCAGWCRAKGWGWPATFAVSSIGFGLLHLSHGPLTVVNATLFGVLALGARRMGQSLLPPIALHFFYNFILWQAAYH